MKKVLALLLVIAFGATFVAAEGVTFGAWTRTVYNVAAGSTDPASVVTQSLGPNWYGGGVGGANGNGGLYASLNLNYQGPVLGYHIGWETDGGTLITNPTHFLNFNVSVNLVADLLTLQIGKISSDQFKLAKSAEDYVNGGRNWLLGRFEVSGRSNLGNVNLVDKTGVKYTGPALPVTAQNLNDWIAAQTNPGYGLAAAQLTLAPKDSGLVVAVYMPLSESNSALSDDVDNLFVGASYAIPSVGKITLVSTPNANGELFYGSSFTRTFDLGFQLTAVKGLDVLVAGGYMMNRYDTTGKSDAIAANVGVSFNIDVFSMGVTSYMKFPLATNPTSNISIDANPALNLGVVSLGETVSFDLTLPSAGASTTSWRSYTWVSINPISVKLGFDIKGSSTAGSFVQWAIPVAIDVGF